ncbi:DUF4192 domain-containing protein [Pseudarthrobacter sp. J1738]|uniref:DUF4192 domain-containing protein n=1 Tax=Pseudarthrobacter sp. J1738 TaxID=3420446 RepID=UPI003D2E41CC
MNPTETLKASRAEDVLGYVPHTLGYWPTNSLVCVTMSKGRLGATLRVDLPPADISSFQAHSFSARVVDYLLSDERADGVLIAIYPPALLGPSWQPCMELLESLECAVEGEGLVLRDAWVIGTDLWRNCYCQNHECCPPQGRSLEDIRNSPLSAELIYRGSALGAAPGINGQSADELSIQTGPFGRLSPQQAAAVLPEENRLREQLLHGPRGGASAEALLAQWEPFLSGENRCEVSASDAAALRAGLSVPLFRDTIMVQAAGGLALALDGVQEITRCEPLDVAAADQRDSAQETVDHYAEFLMGQSPAGPNWKRMDTFAELLGALLFDGPGGHKAPVLAVLGWIEWCRGRGSMAGAHLDAALGHNPDYRLAELLSELIARGHLSNWARNRATAWHGIQEDSA